MTNIFKTIGPFLVATGISGAQIAYGDFFKQLNIMLDSGELTQSESDFLKEIDQLCSLMKKSEDRSYFDKTGSQSAKSTQSRICATVIDQYDPLINIYGTNMRSCTKFRTPVRLCCDAFTRGYENSETKNLASVLCSVVPSHFKLMNGFKRKQIAERKKYEQARACFHKSCR